MTLSIQEMITMIFILGECGKNCLLSSKVYAARYPDAERKPRKEAFQNLLERFEETGNVEFTKRKVIDKPVNNENNQLTVLLSVQENPHVSTREISQQTDITRTSIKRILKLQKYHGYHIELHQELYERDFDQRVTFCNWMTNKIREIPHFFNNILFSDEASFKSNGIVGRHNMHFYSTENPHWVRLIDYQRYWSLNVWAGIVGSHIIGPYFFDNRLSGEIYVNFLRNDLPQLLQQINENDRENLWFQHDGAPPHYHINVREYLNQWKINKWIGRGGPIAWPPRSPDLTPLDYFLWGYVKQCVYRDPPTTAQNMKERIREAFRTVTPQMLENVKRNFVMRLNKCLEVEGRTFEHLL